MIVGAESGGEARGVEKVGIEARNLEENAAGALVPIEREIAVDFSHSGGAFIDGRNARGSLRGSTTALGVEKERGQESQ